ncbi:MAG: hypothetical protein U0U67_10185 [Chitinophagales bacterium]
MYIKITEIKDALEASYIRSILDEENIPYTITEFSDSAYIGLNEAKYGFGILEAPDEFKAQILALVKTKNTDSNSFNETEEEKIKPKLEMSNVLTVLFFGTTVLFLLLYLNAKKRFTHITDHKNTHVDWVFDNTTMLTKWNKGDVLKCSYIDANFDHNFEKFSVFDLDGDLIEEATDKNEDGIFEKKITYNKKGENTESYFDFNNDLRNEKVKSVIKDKLSITFEDENYDGEFDTVTFFNLKDSIVKTIPYSEYLNRIVEIAK